MRNVTERRLEDLISVGPAIRRDFALLGIHTVAQLARREPEVLYQEVCRKTRKQQDVCVLNLMGQDRARTIRPELRVVVDAQGQHHSRGAA